VQVFNDMAEGHFVKDKRHGWGKRIYADGRIYEGSIYLTK